MGSQSGVFYDKYETFKNLDKTLFLSIRKKTFRYNLGPKNEITLSDEVLQKNPRHQ